MQDRAKVEHSNKQNSKNRENSRPVAITVAGVTKSFRIYSDKSHTLKERIINWRRGNHSVHKVLKGIDLEIRKGDTVALIGQNGSGKSTLLKLLTGIMYPDSGSIDIKGKVSSLLELGAGFHPDFTGRENIYNNASIFGLSKKEIDQRFNRIVAFSELEEYIDSPVRTYSSGMYMRLAFSVAINVDADILLIDEILAVGDANFQKKCMDMIRRLKRRGVTIVLVTHDMGSVDRICDRAVWLVDGYLRLQGKPREVIDAYMLDMDEKSNVIAQKERKREAAEQEERKTDREQQGIPVLTKDLTLSEPETEANSSPEPADIILPPTESLIENMPPDQEQSESSELPIVEIEAEVEPEVVPEVIPEDPSAAMLEYDENNQKIRWGNGSIQITNVEIFDGVSNKSEFVTAGSDLIVQLHYHAFRSVDSIIYGIAVRNPDGTLCIGTNSDLRRIHFDVPSEGEKGIVRVVVKNIELTKGSYTLDVAVHSLEGVPYDYQQGKHAFMVSNTFTDVGAYAPKLSMKVIKEA